MTAAKPKPVTITSRRRRSASPVCCWRRRKLARCLCVRAWRRRRHGASVHGGGCAGACRTRRRQLALSISVYGGGRQAPRSAEARASRGARGGHGSRAAHAVASALCRRKILRRPHDLAGAGRVAASRACAGLAFFGFPLHPTGKPSDERAEHLSDVKVPMLFLQGTRDCARGREAAQGRDQTARRARDAQAVRGCRSFLPRAGALGPQGRGCAATKCWMRSRIGRAGVL